MRKTFGQPGAVYLKRDGTDGPASRCNTYVFRPFRAPGGGTSVISKPRTRLESLQCSQYRSSLLTGVQGLAVSGSLLSVFGSRGSSTLHRKFTYYAPLIVPMAGRVLILQ